MILEAIALYMSDASSTKPLKSLGTPRRPKVFALSPTTFAGNQQVVVVAGLVQNK